MSGKWSSEETEKLIELYQQHENLYNIKSSDYYNRNKREKSLNEIAQKIKDLKKNVTVDMIQSKIKGLRSQYSREKKEVLKSKRSGAGADEIYTPKLWCFNELSFLDIYLKEREGSSNIKDEIFDNSPELQEYSSTADAPISKNSFSQVPKKRKENVDDIRNTAISALDMAMKMQQKKEKNYDEYFAKFICTEMEKIKDEEVLSEAKFEIHKIIKDAISKSRRKEAQRISWRQRVDSVGGSSTNSLDSSKYYCEMFQDASSSSNNDTSTTFENVYREKDFNSLEMSEIKESCGMSFNITPREENKKKINILDIKYLGSPKNIKNASQNKQTHNAKYEALNIDFNETQEPKCSSTPTPEMGIDIVKEAMTGLFTSSDEDIFE